jgi:hypothetical protein
MEQLDGIAEPEVTVSTEEWKTAGGLARIIDGAIVIGKTAAEQAAEATAATTAARIAALRRSLAETDYIAAKIAEGSATQAEYADTIAPRQTWRNEINELLSA